MWPVTVCPPWPKQPRALFVFPLHPTLPRPAPAHLRVLLRVLLCMGAQLAQRHPLGLRHLLAIRLYRARIPIQAARKGWREGWEGGGSSRLGGVGYGGWGGDINTAARAAAAPAAGGALLLPAYLQRPALPLCQAQHPPCSSRSKQGCLVLPPTHPDRPARTDSSAPAPRRERIPGAARGGVWAPAAPPARSARLRCPAPRQGPVPRPAAVVGAGQWGVCICAAGNRRCRQTQQQAAQPLPPQKAKQDRQHCGVDRCVRDSSQQEPCMLKPPHFRDALSAAHSQPSPATLHQATAPPHRSPAGTSRPAADAPPPTGPTAPGRCAWRGCGAAPTARPLS